MASNEWILDNMLHFIETGDSHWIKTKYAFSFPKPCPYYNPVEMFLLTPRYLRSDNLMECHIFSPFLSYQFYPLEQATSLIHKDI